MLHYTESVQLCLKVREEWTVHATITDHENEKVTVNRMMPIVNRVSENIEEMGFVRRFAKSWKKSINEIKCS